MKNLVSAILLSGFLASCAPSTVINSAGVEVPDASLEAKYYQALGEHRKATVLRREEGFDFISNAYQITEQSDEFRGLSWTWYKPQQGFNEGGAPVDKLISGFGLVKIPPSNFKIYFAKNGKGSTTAFLHAEYSGGDWLFFDTVSVKAENKKPLVLASGLFITETKVLGGGWVQEIYNKSQGATEFLNYMKGVPDKTPFTVRLTATKKQQENVSYNYFNNKPVIDEMLSLIK